jgi:hypothetical protein
MKKLNEWVKTNPFWAESLRAILFAVAGTLVALWYINYQQNKMNFNWDKKRARLDIQLESINTFLKTSYEYTSLSNRYKEDSIPKSDLRDKYDYFRNCLHIMKINCNEIDPLLPGSGETLSGQMMLLLSSRDSLKKITIGEDDAFEITRKNIKTLTDNIAVRLNSIINE